MQSHLNSQFSLILDQLWRRSNERLVLAKELSQSLTHTDWLMLAGWDTAAYSRLTPGEMVFDQPNQIRVTSSAGDPLVNASLVKVDQANEDKISILYQDINLGVIIQPNLVTKIYPTAKHELRQLLLAAQFIRDHLDSTLFKPLELREAELEEVASLCEFDMEYFKRLCIWYSALAVRFKN
jgi:hypothetical protein